MTKQISTTPTIALFLIVSVTGIFLLFHMGSGNLKVIHEWLGLVFVVFGILHALANWPLLKRYFGGMKAVAIGLMVVAAVTFSVFPSTSSKGKNPMQSVIAQVKKAPLATIAILYGQETERVVQRLRDNGYTLANVDSTLEEIARQNNVPAEKIISVIHQYQ